MEMTVIETNALEAMQERYGLLKHEITELCRQSENKRLKEYYDNHDVCLLLHISKRTLQNYRDSGKISFTRIQNKIYYRPGDITKFIEKAKTKQKAHGRIPE